MLQNVPEQVTGSTPWGEFPSLEKGCWPVQNVVISSREGFGLSVMNEQGSSTHKSIIPQREGDTTSTVRLVEAIITVFPSTVMRQHGSFSTVTTLAACQKVTSLCSRNQEGGSRVWDLVHGDRGQR